MILPTLVAVVFAQAPEIKVESPAFLCGYSSLRRWAEDPARAPEGMREAAFRFRALTDKLGSGESAERDRALSLSLLDAVAATATRSSDLTAFAAALPDGWQRSSLTKEWLLEAAATIQNSVGLDVPKSDADLLNSRRQELRVLTDKYLPKAWAWLTDKLGIEKPLSSLSILLVPRVASPGAVTLRTSQGIKIVIGAETFSGSSLLEALLHESIHASEASSGRVTVLDALRKSEALAKFSAKDRAQLPHTLYFLAAADAVRQSLPEHKDVGVTTGVYDRGLEPYRKHLAPLWADYVAGRISEAEFVAKAAKFGLNQPGS